MNVKIENRHRKFRQIKYNVPFNPICRNIKHLQLFAFSVNIVTFMYVTLLQKTQPQDQRVRLYKRNAFETKNQDSDENASMWVILCSLIHYYRISIVCEIDRSWRAIHQNFIRFKDCKIREIQTVVLDNSLEICFIVNLAVLQTSILS